MPLKSSAFTIFSSPSLINSVTLVPAGTKVTLLINEGEEKIVKALDLSGTSGLLYYRDSLTGKVCAKPKASSFKLNKELFV